MHLHHAYEHTNADCVIAEPFIIGSSSLYMAATNTLGFHYSVHMYVEIRAVTIWYIFVFSSSFLMFKRSDKSLGRFSAVTVWTPLKMEILLKKWYQNQNHSLRWNWRDAHKKIVATKLMLNVSAVNLLTNVYIAFSSTPLKRIAILYVDRDAFVMPSILTTTNIFIVCNLDCE